MQTTMTGLNVAFDDMLSASAMAALLVPLALCGAASGQAQPRHPVMDHGIDAAKAADYEQAVERVMAMSDDELLAFVPDKPFTAYCECPQCYGGVEGNQIFTWSIDRPQELKCKFCETVFPNEEYPEDQVLEGQNKLGETIRYQYHQGQERDVPHFLTGNLARYRRGWLMQQCIALGKAYHVTRNEEYARRVVLVLDRIAQVYPHYPVIRNLPRRFTFRESQDPPFPWDSGRWGYFHNEIPKPVLTAYDLVYHSDQFDRLSQERGYDVRQTLENDFLRPTFEAVAAVKNHIYNVVGYDVAGAAILGRVIHEPRYVHWAYRWMRKNVDAGCFYDGLWHEAPSYHYMTMGGLRSAFGTVKGYSDPPGYVDEVDGTRFDDLDPEQELPFYARALHAPEVLDFPNGCSTTVHDTHPYEKRSRPRDKTVSTIAPGYGHASLGRGTGADQMQAQLHFSGGHGHTHLDNLNLTLWAKEREMLADLGYTWTQMRYWCTCTAGHNTVVIDRADQRGSNSDGDLLCFFPDTGGVSVVAADGKRAYSNIEGLDTYRRMLVMIPVSDSDAYVVDLFRLRGGATHDWALHGDADKPMDAACSLPLADERATMLEPGEEWVEPQIEGSRFNPYGMMREMQSAQTDGGFRVDFAYVEEPERGLRLHVLPNGPSEVFLGKSPSVRGAGQGSRADMRKAYDFWMPQLLVRQRGEPPIAGLFAAVEEPFLGKPFIKTVEPVALTLAHESAIALRVTHGDTVDTIISTLDEPPYSERATPDGIRLHGKLGLLRQREGSPTEAWLFEGVSLAGNGLSLSMDQGALTGEIAAATRQADGAEHDAFITDAELPLGETLRAAWMIVTHGNGYTHGYEMDRVEERDGRRVIVLSHDHGLKIDEGTTREVFYPQREIAGFNTFRIPLSASR